MAFFDTFTKNVFITSPTIQTYVQYSLYTNDSADSRVKTEMICVGHRLKMELDLQCLFRLNLHSCTHWLHPATASPPPLCDPPGAGSGFWLVIFKCYELLFPFLTCQDLREQSTISFPIFRQVIIFSYNHDKGVVWLSTVECSIGKSGCGVANWSAA